MGRPGAHGGFGHGPDGAVSISTVETTRSRNDMIIGQLSKTGEVLGQQEGGAGPLGISDPFKPISARFAVTCLESPMCGRRSAEFPGTGKNVLSSAGCRARVIGWRITPDGRWTARLSR